MVTDLFGALLQELGRSLQIKDLHPDRNNTCQIKLATGVTIYVELDRSKECLVIGSDIAQIPAGRFRENVFREAMKANGLPQPRHGTFAYSKQADRLVLFDKCPVKDLNGEKIAAIITPLAEKAQLWKEAIARGDVPTVSSVRTGRVGMFGMKP